jgi:hypothetical protein
MLDEPALVFIRVTPDSTEYAIHGHDAALIGSFVQVKSRDREVRCAELRNRDGDVVLTLREWPLGDAFAVEDAEGRELAQVGPRQPRWQQTLRPIRTCEGFEATMRLPIWFGDAARAGILDDSGDMVACLHGIKDGTSWFMVEIGPGLAAPTRAVAAVAPMIWRGRIWSSE